LQAAAGDPAILRTIEQAGARTVRLNHY